MNYSELRVIESGPTGRKTTFALAVSGPLTLKSIRHIQRRVSLLLDVMNDDAEPTDANALAAHTHGH